MGIRIALKKYLPIYLRVVFSFMLKMAWANRLIGSSGTMIIIIGGIHLRPSSFPDEKVGNSWRNIV